MYQKISANQNYLIFFWNGKLLDVEEDKEDDDHGYDKADESESIRIGGKKGQERMSDEPLETQKASIVKQLVGMNENIRNFSERMEEKLEKAYKAGNYNKKFGYDAANAKDM